jgi:hypothetical protein
METNLKTPLLKIEITKLDVSNKMKKQLILNNVFVSIVINLGFICLFHCGFITGKKLRQKCSLFFNRPFK